MEKSLTSCASQELMSVSGSFTPVNQRKFHNSIRTLIVVFSYAFMQDAWLILELHDNALHSIPPRGILPGDYYAVDYVKNYYFGRVLEASESSVKFKFLHKVDTSTFDWHKGMTLTVPIYHAFSLSLSIFDTIGHSKLRKKQLWRRCSSF